MTTAMTFQDANDMALEFGAKKFRNCSPPVAAGDRPAWCVGGGLEGRYNFLALGLKV